MQAIKFSRNPAVWIGLLAAVAVAVVNSGAVPVLSDNAAALSVVITAVAGYVTRFFVTPAVASTHIE